MEPVPESARLYDELRRFDNGVAPLAQLGDQVQELVPCCVGLSLTLLQDALTVTLVSSSSSIASIDALQYLDGGPCPSSVTDGGVQHWTNEQVRERDRWRLFAGGESLFGIESTLSLPVRIDGVTASVNLYATQPDAFDGHVERVAALCGASATDAVKDADLSFTSRLRAAAAPLVLAERDEVDLAVGLLAGTLGLDVDTAEKRLREAAARANVTVPHLARVVKESVAP